MALFSENMTAEERRLKAVAIIRMGSPLSEGECDEISSLLFLDGLTNSEFYSEANKKSRIEKRLAEFDSAVKPSNAKDVEHG